MWLEKKYRLCAMACVVHLTCLAPACLVNFVISFFHLSPNTPASFQVAEYPICHCLSLELSLWFSIWLVPSHPFVFSSNVIFLESQVLPITLRRFFPSQSHYAQSLTLSLTLCSFIGIVRILHSYPTQFFVSLSINFHICSWSHFCFIHNTCLEPSIVLDTH